MSWKWTCVSTNGISAMDHLLRLDAPGWASRPRYVGTQPRHAALDHRQLVHGATTQRRQLHAHGAVEPGRVEDGEQLPERRHALTERDGQRATPDRGVGGGRVVLELDQECPRCERP